MQWATPMVFQRYQKHVMGIDGLLIETHPNPKIAKSDASQQLNYTEFENLLKQLKGVAASVGYKMI
jgi:3-deoxy-7-phosphoheptulonate synthase